jgi:hypothetical protein
MHGGAKGSGAPKGPRHGLYRHGQFTCDAVEERRKIRVLIKEWQQTLEDL